MFLLHDVYTSVTLNQQEASDIIEYAFNEFATAPQRVAILEEFYGPAFALCKVGFCRLSALHCEGLDACCSLPVLFLLVSTITSSILVFL